MDTSGFFLILFTGVMVIALSYGLDRLWAAAAPGRIFYLIIRAPGVVLHECSHIIGCIVTGARIHKIVLFSQDGGSVTYSRPALPLIGDVIISTAPLFLLPLALSFITWAFSVYLGCIFPVFPTTLQSSAELIDLGRSVIGTFPDNLHTRFNGWFLLFLYLTVSIVLSAAPSSRDLKNAAAGSGLLILAGIITVWSGIPWAVAVLDSLVRLLGYGFMLGLVYGLVALAISLPLLVWYLHTHRS
jgi:hypothetical protein